MQTRISTERRPETVVELLKARAEQAPDGVATYHSEAGAWRPTTWSVLWGEAKRAAAAFRGLGLAPGDRLAILAHTCLDWQVAELGAHLAGAAVVGIEAHAAREQIAWILEQAAVSGVIVDSREHLARIPDHVRNRLKFQLTLQHGPGTATPDAVRSWTEILAMTDVPPAPPWTPAATDPAIVIYTSGTTGAPKGIEYSHGQLMTACRAMLDEFPDFGQERLVCWLPMAALFQRMMNLLSFASHSVTYFVEDPREIMTRLTEIKPTVFTSVPRFYEKVHEGIQQRLAAQSGFQKRLIRAALAAGAEWSQCLRRGTRPTWALRVRHAVLDRLVLGRIRGAMGGEIKWMISGSAAAPAWLLEFFHSIGLLVLEAYGITENPVPIAANRSDAYRFGSVGRPFLMNHIRLAEDGEVLVKGPAMFRGYLAEGLPADRLTADGYYRTGDYAQLDADGFLYLKGRLAEIIKTTTGRRVSPAAVEEIYRQSRYVDQIVVVGNNRPWLVALVVLNGAGAEAGAAALDRDFARLGEQLSRHEQVRAFTVLPAPFSVEAGELTPTLKLRRRQIEDRHAELIERLYSGARDVTPAGVGHRSPGVAVGSGEA